jgi:glyoxylase-like metal-dependent hydrolase (beta-lactamase superfamily II)
MGRGLYMITDNAYQSVFMVHDSGVVVVDAPPAYAAQIRTAIAEVTDRPVTHVVNGHAHIDHIGGAKELGGTPVIVAHDETARLLRLAADRNRPVPTVTFADRYTLRAGGQVLELTYPGNGHQPGNIYVHAPAQRVLMVVDVVFPGVDAVAPFRAGPGRERLFRAGGGDRTDGLGQAGGRPRGAHGHARGRSRSRPSSTGTSARPPATRWPLPAPARG